MQINLNFDFSNSLENTEQEVTETIKRFEDRLIPFLGNIVTIIADEIAEKLSSKQGIDSEKEQQTEDSLRAHEALAVIFESTPQPIDAVAILENIGDALKQGFVFEKTTNGGYRLIAPDGTPVTAAAPQEPVTHSGL